MWQEIIGIVGSGILVGSGYIGLYKLSWYLSKKEQLKKIKLKLKEINELEKMNDELKEYKQQLINHMEKIDNHKIQWGSEKLKKK